MRRESTKEERVSRDKTGGTNRYGGRGEEPATYVTPYLSCD